MKYKYSYLLQNRDGLKYFMTVQPPSPSSFFIIPRIFSQEGYLDVDNFFGVYGSILNGRANFISEFIYPIVVFLNDKFPKEFANQFIAVDHFGWDVLKRNPPFTATKEDLNLIHKFNKQAEIPSPDKFYILATLNNYLNLKDAFIGDGGIKKKDFPKNLPILYKKKKYLLSSSILPYLIGFVSIGKQIFGLEIPLSTWSEFFSNYYENKIDNTIAEKILWQLDMKVPSEKINRIFESLLLGE